MRGPALPALRVRWALRLETHDQAWVLPPARAALIEAGRPIRGEHPASGHDRLGTVRPGVHAAPPAPLTVFDLSPLARALLAECSGWGESSEPLPAYAETLFAALAAVTWRLAEQPSPVACRRAGHRNCAAPCV